MSYSTYIICHGHNNATVFKTEYGSNDDGGLTEKGIIEVENATIPVMNGKTIVVSSPKNRCKETAQIIAARMGIDNVIIEPLLDERDHGVFNGTKIDTEVNKLIEQMDRYGDKPHFGVETIASMVDSVKTTIQNYQAVKANIVFVTHLYIRNIFINLSRGCFNGLHHTIDNMCFTQIDLTKTYHPRNEYAGVESYLYAKADATNVDIRESILIGNVRIVERTRHDQNLQSYIEQAGMLQMKRYQPAAPFTAFIGFGKTHSIDEILDLVLLMRVRLSAFHTIGNDFEYIENGIYIETNYEYIIHEIAHRFNRESWTVTYWTPNELNKEVFNVTYRSKR